MLKAWLRLRLQPLHAGQKYRLQSKRLYSEESSTGTTTFSPDGHSTLRRRQYDNKPLPLPPLLDPIALEAKERHTRPKAARDELEKTAFQRKLELNAHAQVLATTIRQCAFTQARLPSHFLIPFRAHLTEFDNAVAGTTGHKGVHAELIPELHSSRHVDESVTLSPVRTYVLGQSDVIDNLKGKSRWVHLLSERMKKWYGVKVGKSWERVDFKKSWEWDGEMGEKILRMLRAEVVARLEEAAGMGDALTAVDMDDASLATEELACMLTIRDPVQAKRTNDDVIDVPTFDLRELLDEDTRAACVQVSGLADSKTLAVSATKEGTRLHVALLKLRTYIGDAG